MGMALYGNDIDDTVTPLEANLAWIVKLDEGRLRRPRRARQAEGARASRASSSASRSAERAFPRHGYPVFCNGEPSGVVCSGTMSPTLGIPIGTCYLPTAGAKEGTRVRDRHPRQARAGRRVVKMPFYKNASHL